MLNIVLFGPPGAGKGTQSEKIIEKYHLSHISTGDLFRRHKEDDTDLGRQAQQYMDAGNLVPDSLVIDMVDEKIKNTPDAEGFIFDGFPRTVAQAEALDKLLTDKDTPISGMIALEVEDEELKKRIRKRAETSGRVDDQDEAKIENRIRVYKQETLPVAGHYQQQGKLHTVQGEGSVEEIFANICQVIDGMK
jgi:adenylate kinase